MQKENLLLSVLSSLLGMLSLCAHYPNKEFTNVLLTTHGSPMVTSFQVRVPNQFDLEAHSAFCGLEALHNGIALAKAITTKHSTTAFKLLSDDDVSKRRNNFDRWKKIVGVGRAQALIKKVLSKMLAPLLTSSSGTEQKRSFLKHKMSEFSALLVSDKDGTLENDTISYTFTGSDMRKAIVKSLAIREETLKKNNEKSDIVFLDNEIDTYFKLDDIKISMSEKIQRADWLVSEELDWILEQTKISQDLNVPIFHVAGNLAPIRSLTYDETLKTNKEFQKFNEAFQSSNTSCTGIFLVYYKPVGWQDYIKGHQTAAEYEHAFSNGHWYCVVANKKGSVRQYIVADSMKNEIRLEDGRLLELADLLEGDAVNSNIAKASDSVVDIPESEIIDSRVLSNRTGLARKARKFVSRHPILTGVTAGLLSVFVVHKFLNRNKQEPKLRSPLNSDELPDEALHLLRSIPRGRLHGTYNLP